MGNGSIRRVASWFVATVTTLTIVGAAVSPAHAAFPGENGRIVFDTVWAFWNGRADASQIYSVLPDGSDLRPLTDVGPGTAAWHPAVSPEATRIAYVVSADGKDDQVWLMRPDGSHQRRLVHEPGWSQTGPSFTANGRRVLYSRCGNYVAFYWTCKIVSVRLDGSGGRTIIGGRWHPSDPVMSPDGSRVAFVSDAGGYDARIWLADPDGSHRAVLEPNFIERLSWSADGTHLAFTAYRTDGVSTIATDGSGLQQILPSSDFGAWSPDGSQIVSKVIGPDEGFGPLQVTSADGSDPTEIVDVSYGVGYSDWGIAR
jgi:Tol biopolymer transport system component